MRNEGSFGEFGLDRFPNLDRLGKVVGKGPQKHLVRIEQNDNRIVVLGGVVGVSQSVLQPVPQTKGFVKVLEIETLFDGCELRREVQMEPIRHDANLLFVQLGENLGIVVSATTGNPRDGPPLTRFPCMKEKDVGLPILKIRTTR